MRYATLKNSDKNGPPTVYKHFNMIINWSANYYFSTKTFQNFFLFYHFTLSRKKIPLFFIFCFNECLPFSLIFLPSLCVCSYICFGFAQSEIHIFFPILIDGLSSMFVDYNQLADIFRHIFNLMAKLVAPLLAWHKVREFKSS